MTHFGLSSFPSCPRENRSEWGQRTLSAQGSRNWGLRGHAQCEGSVSSRQLVIRMAFSCCLCSFKGKLWSSYWVLSFQNPICLFLPFVNREGQKGKLSFQVCSRCSRTIFFNPVWQSTCVLNILLLAFKSQSETKVTVLQLWMFLRE